MAHAADPNDPLKFLEKVNQPLRHVCFAREIAGGGYPFSCIAGFHRFEEQAPDPRGERRVWKNASWLPLDWISERDVDEEDRNTRTLTRTICLDYRVHQGQLEQRCGS